MKSGMKKLCVLMSLFLGTGISYAQEAVFDAANTAQAVKQVSAWKTQLAQMNNQLMQAKQTYESLTQSRGFGQLMNNPQLLNTLPPDWAQVYRAVQSGGYKGLTTLGQQVRSANMIYDDCTGKTGQALSLCQRSQVKSAQDKAFGLNAYDQAQRRLDNIQGMMTQVNVTSNPKEVAEIQARLAAEQALIANEANKLQLFRMMADAEDKLIQQQKREASVKDFNNKSTARDGSLKPVKF